MWRLAKPYTLEMIRRQINWGPMMWGLIAGKSFLS